MTPPAARNETKNNIDIMLKRLIYLVLPALLAIGCDLREDLSHCGVLRLNLKYTYNNDNVDKLIGHVGDIRIYVFDASETLTRIVRPTAADIERGYYELRYMPGGRYTFVAWAGSGTDIEGSGFKEVHMSDPAAHNRTGNVTVGETTLEELYMMIDYDTLPTEILGDVAPKSHDFVDLFHASVENFEVKPAESQTVDFDFIRNTNVLKVTVTGIQHLSTGAGRAVDAPLSIYAVGRNGRYKWDNTIDPHARLVRYEPPYSSLTDTQMKVDIKTVHLDLSRHIDDPVNLHLTDLTTRAGIPDQPLDIIAAIRQVKDAQGNYLYRTQEAIDREYEFPIDIVILDPGLSGDITIKIFIKEWEIELPNANIDRP
jgi:hypothetical protein